MPAIHKINFLAGLIDPHIHAVKPDLWHFQDGFKAKRLGLVNADLGQSFFLVYHRGPIFVWFRRFLQCTIGLLGNGTKFAGSGICDSRYRVDEQQIVRVGITQCSVFVIRTVIAIVVADDENFVYRRDKCERIALAVTL